MSVSADLFYSTIRVECTHDDGISTGTGFFFLYEKDANDIHTIITNRHVVEGSKQTRLIFHRKNNESDIFVTDTVSFNSDLWCFHPDNLDLAILKLTSIGTHINRIYELTHKPLYLRCFSESLIPNEEKIKNLNYIEDILVIGYPSGLYDPANNTPIAKRGITATPIQLDYNGKPEFLIDAAIYPGSSGSPVAIYNQGSYLENNTLQVGSRLLLIGINYGTYLSNTFKNGAAQNEIQVANNLGICIKASRLLDFKPLL